MKVSIVEILRYSYQKRVLVDLDPLRNFVSGIPIP